MRTFNMLPLKNKNYFQCEVRLNQCFIILLLILILVIFCCDIFLINKKKDLEKNIRLVQNKIDRLSILPLTSPATVLVKEHYIPIKSDIMQRLLQSLSVPYSENVCFTDISHIKNITIFNGQVRNSMMLTEFLKKWQVVGLFSELHLEKLTQNSSQQMIFRLRALTL